MILSWAERTADANFTPVAAAEARPAQPVLQYGGVPAHARRLEFKGRKT
jgi:hypothetical protein